MQVNHTITAEALLPAVRLARVLHAEKRAAVFERVKRGELPGSFTVGGDYFAASDAGQVGRWSPALGVSVASLQEKFLDLDGVPDPFLTLFRQDVQRAAEAIRAGDATGGEAGDVIWEAARRVLSRWSTHKGCDFLAGNESAFCLDVRTLTACRLLAWGRQLSAKRDVELGEKFLMALVSHLLSCADYLVCNEKSDGPYSEPGRVQELWHFHPKTGRSLGPGCREGWSPHSCWSRALGLFIFTFVDMALFLSDLANEDFPWPYEKKAVLSRITESIRAASSFYFRRCSPGGILPWDTAAPGWSEADLAVCDSNPAACVEPVDAAATALIASSLIRFGQQRGLKGDDVSSQRWTQAGLTAASTILGSPFLSENVRHHGILLHVVDSRLHCKPPNPRGFSVPCLESSVAGDLAFCHMLEVIEAVAACKKMPSFSLPMPKTAEVNWERLKITQKK